MPRYCDVCGEEIRERTRFSRRNARRGPFSYARITVCEDCVDDGDNRERKSWIVFFATWASLLLAVSGVLLRELLLRRMGSDDASGLFLLGGFASYVVANIASEAYRDT